MARVASSHPARPKLVKLKPPKGDGKMARTLLFLLERVRQGKVKAFSLCIIGDGADDTTYSVESASADGDSTMELHLLGIMRMAEHNLVQRIRERQDGEVDGESA